MTRQITRLALGGLLSAVGFAAPLSAQYAQQVEDYFLVDQVDSAAAESDSNVFLAGELGAFDPAPVTLADATLPAAMESTGETADQPSLAGVYLTAAVDTDPPPPNLVSSYGGQQLPPVVARPLPSIDPVPTHVFQPLPSAPAVAAATPSEPPALPFQPVEQAPVVPVAVAPIAAPPIPAQPVVAPAQPVRATPVAPPTVAVTTPSQPVATPSQAVAPAVVNVNINRLPAEADQGVQTTGLEGVLNGGCLGVDCGGCAECASPICCPGPCGCAGPCGCVPTYWIGGVEATFLSPDLNRGNVSYRLQDQFVSPELDATFGSNDIAVDDFYAAPRLWLGVQHGCWGIVGRYWHMQAAEHLYDPFTYTPAGPTWDYGYFIDNRFEAYTTDLEGTRSFCFHDTRNTISFGARYGSLTHDASLSADAQISDGASGFGVISGNARSNRRAFGTGITSSFYGRKPLFCNSCIHLYYGLRGSILWGKITNSVETDTIEVTAGASAGSYNGAFTAVNDSFFIGEAQLGLQWDYRVMCFPADAFFRAGIEYQYWDATTGSATATSFAGFGGPAPTTFSQGQAFANADGLSLDLIGISVATGFMW